MRRSTPAVTAALGVLAGPALAGSTTVRYDIVDLGLTEAHSNVCPCFFGLALNNEDEATGFFFGTDGTYNAFAYVGGAMLDISGGDNLTFGRGMNDLGWVVGWTDQFAPQHAFLWDGTQLIDLGTLGGTYSDGHDVNDAGQVVGSASTPIPQGDDSHAMIWQDGEMTDLGTLGGPFSEAFAINENGFIVGWSWNAAWDARAVYWNTDLTGPFELPSFGPPDRFTYANDVNDAGIIVGQVEVESVQGFPTYRAARWENGEVEDLGLLPEAGIGINEYFQISHVSTAAHAINESGVIVGMSFPHAIEPEVRFGPFVHRDGVMKNLNDLLLPGGDLIVTEVRDINDAGVIVGSARLPDENFSRAVLLVPVEFTLGDLDLNGSVGVPDLLALLAGWGPCPDVGPCAADLNDDRVVGVGDLLVLLANWGA